MSEAKQLSAEDVRGLKFRAQFFGDGEKGFFMQQYVAVDHPEIHVVVTGYRGRKDTKREICVGDHVFPDGEFQAVADAYNALSRATGGE